MIWCEHKTGRRINNSIVGILKYFKLTLHFNTFIICRMSGTSSATASRTLQFPVEKSMVRKVKRMEVSTFEQPASALARPSARYRWKPNPHSGLDSGVLLLAICMLCIYYCSVISWPYPGDKHRLPTQIVFEFSLEVWGYRKCSYYATRCYEFLYIR